MNLAQNAGAVGLQSINRLLAGGFLTLFSGSQPASPETALSGNTALAQFTFAVPAFGEATRVGNFMTATGSFVNSSVSPLADGTIVFARATLNSTPWAGSKEFFYGNITSNAGLFFICVGPGTSAPSGGPSVTGEGIADGTATWNCIGSTTGQGNVVADYSCGVSNSGADIILSSTTATIGVPVQISTMTQSIPVV
jgi:hypothetical protein